MWMLTLALSPTVDTGISVILVLFAKALTRRGVLLLSGF